MRALDALQFTGEGAFDACGAALTPSHAKDMGAVHLELVRHAGDDSAIQSQVCENRPMPRRKMRHKDAPIPLVYYSGIEHVNRRMKGLNKAVAGKEWAPRIRQLRERLGLNQAEFARDVGASQVAISRWEAGDREPEARFYLRLAALAGPPESFFFLQNGGLDPADFDRAIRSETPKTELIQEGSPNVTVPVFHEPILSLRPAPSSATQASSHISFPAGMVPNPSTTSVLIVPDDTMRPIFSKGDLVVVDSSENRRQKLYGQIVAALHRTRGFRVAWLINIGEGVELLRGQEHQTPDLAIQQDFAWRILGFVSWWIGKPQRAEG